MGSILSLFESEPVVKQTFVPVYVPQYRPIEAEKQSVVTRQTVAEKLRMIRTSTYVGQKKQDVGQQKQLNKLYKNYLMIILKTV